MLYYRLEILDKLEAIEEKERLEKEEVKYYALDISNPTPEFLVVDPEVDPAFLLALSDLNSSY